MASSLVLGGVCLLVGFLCGCISIGGILLIPALAALTKLGVHNSMATALFSFMFTAMLGTYLHWRHGSLKWEITWPICLGAAFFGFLGALAKESLGVSQLNSILAVLIILAGLNTICPLRGQTFSVAAASPAFRRTALAALGGGVSFVAGLTGAGGPVLSVPLMILMGFSPLLSVAVAQPFQVIAAASGSVGNMFLGTIDYSLAFWITLVQLVGLTAGVSLANRMNTRHLKSAVAFMCVGTGVYLLVRTLFF